VVDVLPDGNRSSRSDGPRREGRTRWRPPASFGAANGLLTTAGKLIFRGDISGNLVTYDPATGKILWHLPRPDLQRAAAYMLDGRQYILQAAGDTLYAFALYEP
jgi:alcohol dehydrogenase (cytochrome c)